MPQVKYFQVLAQTLRAEMERDERVVLFGEDVGPSGGIFAHTKGLYEAFGPLRVRDTPIAEQTLVGMAVGAAMAGLRPVLEIGFADFLLVCMDQIVNHAAKMRYMSGGQVLLPLVIYSWAGGGIQAGPQHSAFPDAHFAHVPGLKVVAPADPHDLKGLLTAAIRDDNPVLVLLDKSLRSLSGDVTSEDLTIPIGEAIVRRQGHDVTVVAVGKLVHTALKAAEQADQEGISAEVIDLRSLSPLDMDTVLDSLKRTGRLVICHEGVKQYGVGAEVAAGAAEVLDYLDAPVVRVAPPFIPPPFSPGLERAYLPGSEEVLAALREVVK